MHLKVPLEVSLRVPAEPAFLPLAVAFAHNAGLSYGFGEDERYRLELCAEEIFSSLCAMLGAPFPLEIQARNSIHRLTLRFLFHPSPLNLRVLNLTAKTPVESEGEVEELGLFVVARMVDSLKLTAEPDGRSCLSAVIERRYAEETKPHSGSIPLARSWRIHPADRNEIQFFAALAKKHCPGAQCPQFLNFPGKAADMIAAGDLHAALATAEGGALCGGVLWSWVSEKILEMKGPFLFPASQPGALAEALTDRMLEWAAKTSAVGILHRGEVGQAMPAGFDLLGAVEGASNGAITHSFRLLREDEGCAVYCHPGIERFLNAQYDRLVLPRQVRPISSQETASANSVLTCETDKAHAQVLLRPLCFGRDIAGNLRDHLEMFAAENIRTILFEMDLGLAWQAAFAPALFEAGFQPKMIVPYAGRADTVIFQKA